MTVECAFRSLEELVEDWREEVEEPAELKEPDIPVPRATEC